MTATYAVMALAVAALAAAAAADAYGQYAIQTNSPVHVVGTGNEVALIYGDAPGAHRVEIVVDGVQYESQVRDGSFHVTIQAPAPGTYPVSGVWVAESAGPPGSGLAVQVTTGHLEPAVLTILGRGYGDVPDGSVTILAGAHDEGCAGCVEYTADAIGAGGYVLISNADSEKHQFVTESHWAARSTGNLDSGESVRLPFTSEGLATYACIYHPWLEFEVRSTGMYVADDGPGAIHLESPPYAGDSVRIGITHTGGAAMAHVIFIQNGQVLSAGTAALSDGYGVYVVDASGWRVGEVIVSVSAGPDHATDTISVRPPPGAAERSGRITGYEGLDGILVNGGLARPAGIIPLDAASDATRQVCQLGQDALFRGDAGLAPAGTHYTEGTVWCDGVNLGVYLLESGLAIADPAECGMAQSEWLLPYCYPGRLGVPETNKPVADASGIEVVEPSGATDTHDAGPETGGMDPAEDLAVPDPEPDPTADAGGPQDNIIIIPDDVPAVPDAGGPEFESVGDVCDHLTDPECPCPEGWVRNGDWCDPDWYGGIDAAAGAAGDAAAGAGDAVGDAASGVGDAVGGTIATGADGIREGMVGTLSGFFGWISEGFSEIPRLFLELGRWLVDLFW